MKIVLLEPLGIPADTLKELSGKLEAAGHSFRAWDTFTTDTEELIRRGRDADVLMLANHPLPGEVIAACDKVRFISVAFVGIDHVDAKACEERGIPVANTPGYCTDAVAELAGKTVGIIGTGAIGLRTAELFRAFHCRLTGFSRSERQEAKDLGLTYDTLDAVMSKADIISVHTPLTDETRGLIGEKQIAEMKDGAILINTARGPVVDTQALAAALRENRIKAGIDVFEQDPPLPEGHPLLGAPNLVTTPHVAFDTRESIARRAEMAFANVEKWLRGQGAL